MRKWILDEVRERVSWENEYGMRCRRRFHGKMDVGWGVGDVFTGKWKMG